VVQLDLQIVDFCLFLSVVKVTKTGQKLRIFMFGSEEVVNSKRVLATCDLDKVLDEPYHNVRCDLILCLKQVRPTQHVLLHELKELLLRHRPSTAVGQVEHFELLDVVFSAGTVMQDVVVD
jgi:hypothetical protein